MMANRKPIGKNKELLLWAMAAGRCEKCGRLIYKHPLSDAVGNFAQIAHNLPVGDKGPRYQYKPIDPSKNIDDISNLLLLCYDCHREIDEIHPEKYPPEILTTMKADFEEFVVKATNIKRIIPTNVIKYSPNLHGKQLLVVGVQKALFPNKYIEKEEDLTLKNSQYFVGDPLYWEIEIKNLERNYKEKIQPWLSDYTRQNVNMSVFAIAPIPLLVKLGALLSNENNIDVYQLKKSPQQSWEWELTPDVTEYEVNYIQTVSNPEKIIIIFSLSGMVKQDDVKKTLSWDNSTVVEIKTTSKPFDDYLRNKNQLDKFVKCYQGLKEEISHKYDRRTMVHIFAAVPVSVAVEIGRQRNETVDLPLTVYNYTNGAYEKAVVIGETNE